MKLKSLIKIKIKFPSMITTCCHSRLDLESSSNSGKSTLWIPDLPFDYAQGLSKIEGKLAVRDDNKMNWGLLPIFLIVCFSLGIIIIYPSETRAENISLGVSGVVDKYLAVYKASDGSIKAETNIGSGFFADEKLCVINY